jgi:hypothetical protein
MVKVYDKDNLIRIVIGCSLGVLWISLIIWNRLIRELLPKDLSVDEIYSLRFWIVICLLISSVFWSIYILYKLCFKKNSIKKGRLTVILEKRFPGIYRAKEEFSEFSSRYISGSTVYLWRYLHINAPERYKEPVVKLLYKLGLGFNRVIDCTATAVTVLLVYLPRILVFSVFLYEIVVYKKLEYFYSIAILLLIPLIFNGLRRILRDIGEYDCIALELTGIIAYPLEDLPKVKESYIASNNLGALENLEQAEKHLRERIQKGIENGEKVLRYVIGFYNREIPKELYYNLSERYEKAKKLQLTMLRLYETGIKYDEIAKLITSTLLMLSFLFWLLIILK